MSTILSSRLDITAIFCDVDDFYQAFERHWQQQQMLTATCGERLCRSRMCLSEVMTIVIAFHGCFGALPTVRESLSPISPTQISMPLPWQLSSWT